jgi:hypothetical protein
MVDGIDWYSTTLKEYMSSTRIPDAGPNYFAGLTFIDEYTVVAARTKKHILFATFGRTGPPHKVPISYESTSTSVSLNEVSSIKFGCVVKNFIYFAICPLTFDLYKCFGRVAGRPHIFAFQGKGDQTRGLILEIRSAQPYDPVMQVSIYLFFMSGKY